MMLNTVATITGPMRNPCCRNGKAILRAGTNDMGIKRAVRVNGFPDLMAITAITNKAAFSGAAIAQEIVRAD